MGQYHTDQVSHTEGDESASVPAAGVWSSINDSFYCSEVILHGLKLHFPFNIFNSIIWTHLSKNPVLYNGARSNSLMWCRAMFTSSKFVIVVLGCPCIYGYFCILTTMTGPLTVEDVLDYIGFGKFQWTIAFISGLAWVWNLRFKQRAELSRLLFANSVLQSVPPVWEQVGDAMEIIILSILSSQLRCEWRLESYQVALMSTVRKPTPRECWWKLEDVTIFPSGRRLCYLPSESAPPSGGSSATSMAEELWVSHLSYFLFVCFFLHFLMV